MKTKYPKENKVIRVTNKKSEPSGHSAKMENQIERMKFQIDELETTSKKQSHDTLALQTEKQNSLTFDAAPTLGSTNPVTSGGVYTALQNASLNITVDETPTQNSDNAVSSGGVYSALSLKQDRLTIDLNPAQNSLHPVSSDGVYQKLQEKQDVLTAGTGITIDQNNVISASGGGGGMTQEQSTMLTQAYNYYLTHVVEPDPAYNPQTYSEYPAGTIFQTYAKFSQRCNLTFTTTLTSPNMVFSAIDNSSGTLNIKLSFTCSSNFNGTVDIYQNGTSIYHEQYSFNNASLSYIFERTINGITLADGNVFYVKIVSTTSTSFILTKYQADLVAPNAEVINQISPFNVDYFEGKYYISDCSSGTAKIAEIAVQDMFNMNSLTWVDTGIECLQYKTSFNMKQYGNEWIGDERFDYYLGLDNNYTFIRQSDGTTKNNANSSKLDWAQVTNGQLKYVDNYKYGSALNLLTYTLSIFSSALRVNEKFYNLCSAKYLVDITSSSTRVYAVASKADGHLHPYMLHSTLTVTTDLGLGKNQHCYFNNPSGSVAPMICYFNQYGKIIKKEFNYTSATTSFNIINTTEIGSYDEYFEGANNDYFVVKNGALEYYKKTI